MSNVTGYAPYDDGYERDVFIKWPDRESMSEEDYQLANNTLNMLGYVSISKALLLLSVFPLNISFVLIFMSKKRLSDIWLQFVVGCALVTK